MNIGVWFFPDRPAAELVELIVEAERRGLDEVWLGDEGPAREPFTVLAAAAAVTDTIRLGIGITNPYLRAPGLTATTAATLHELSGGRAILGVGAGGQLSLAPFELERDRPLTDVGHLAEVSRAVARGESMPGYRPTPAAMGVGDAPTPVPVWIGARGERLNRLASARADGAFISGLAPALVPTVISWARSVRPIDIGLYLSAVFDPAEVEARRPEMIWGLIDSPASFVESLGLDRDQILEAGAALSEGDERPARELIDDRVLEALLLTGETEAMAERLAELAAAHRPHSLGLALLHDDLADGLDAAVRALEAARRRMG